MCTVKGYLEQYEQLVRAQRPLMSHSPHPALASSFQAIRCTIARCRCDCFQPGKSLVRVCHTCKHGWVAHALDKLGFRSMYQMQGVQVELVQPSVVFDIASLMLYGAQATPIRLKLLLDRLFSVLQHEEVLKVLHGFGWTYEDYARGYILQEAGGRVLDKWNLCTREEEQVILQQFLRFGETKAIAQEIILRDAREQHERHLMGTPKSESEIKKFLERSGDKANNSSGSTSPPVKAMEMRYPIRPFPVAFPATVASAAKMLSPTMMPAYATSPTAACTTPKKDAKESPAKGHIGHGNSSLLAGSPLSRLQTMQPFDCRQNISQLLAQANERSLPTSTPPTRASPHSLADTALHSKHSQLAQSPARPTATPAHAASITEYIPKDPSGALDFSLKESISASTAAAIQATLSSRSSLLMQHASATSAMMNNNSANAGSNPDEQRARAANNRAAPSTTQSKPVPSVQRRNYSPTPGYGGTLVSPSGKKRVLCTACNKTFCDKGALKIHYSAVHLKEMHKCSVPGCNMMFSSRRSRNRHSANPNPKLHVPQNRRKVPDGSLNMDENSTERTMPNLQAPPTNVSAALGVNPIEIKPIAVMPLLSDMAAQQRHLAETFGFAMSQHGGLSAHMCEDLEPGEKRKLDATDLDRLDQVSSSSRSASKKRKSVVPTRISQHNDDMYAISDDNSDNGIAITSSDLEGEDPMIGGSVKSHTTEDVSQEELDFDDDAEIDPLCPQENDSNALEPGELPTCMPSLVPNTTEKSAFDERRERGILDMRSLASNHNKDSKDKVLDSSTSVCKTGDQDAPSDEALDFTITKPDPASKEKEADDSSVLREHDYEEDVEVESPLCDEEGRDDTDSELGEVSIPLDEQDPRRCSSCGKHFLNHFSLKTHYQNVHLKLMHTCSVEGCNAAFPSKRSRDRHSSNFNLHRKLLSTTELSDGTVGLKNSTSGSQNLRDEFLARIYEPHLLAATSAHPSDNILSADEELRHSVSSERSDVNHSNCPEDELNSTPNSQSVCGPKEHCEKAENRKAENKPSTEDIVSEKNETSMEYERCVDEENNESDVVGKSACVNGEEFGVLAVPEDGPMPDPCGDAECHVCSLRFRDNLVLKEHLEKLHPKEMYHCTIGGCDKIFSTRKSRNRHSQNENLHRHIAAAQLT